MATDSDLDDAEVLISKCSKEEGSQNERFIKALQGSLRISKQIAGDDKCPSQNGAVQEGFHFNSTMDVPRHS
jgi:hypothetical protein